MCLCVLFVMCDVISYVLYCVCIVIWLFVFFLWCVVCCVCLSVCLCVFNGCVRCDLMRDSARLDVVCVCCLCACVLCFVYV